MINKKFIGTGVALITPFNADFTVDYNSLEKLGLLVCWNINSPSVLKVTVFLYFSKN